VTDHWPGLHLVRGELEMAPQRNAFTEAHPGTRFDHVGDVYVGHVPYTAGGEDRSITVKGRSWEAVLDALDTYFCDDEPDTG
jgi:hypothetical protein